jgi:hypothetical protein
MPGSRARIATFFTAWTRFPRAPPRGVAVAVACCAPARVTASSAHSRSPSPRRWFLRRGLPRDQVGYQAPAATNSGPAEPPPTNAEVIENLGSLPTSPTRAQTLPRDVIPDRDHQSFGSEEHQVHPEPVMGKADGWDDGGGYTQLIQGNFILKLPLIAVDYAA